MPRNAIIVLLILTGSLFAKAKSSFLPKTFEANFVKEEKAILSGKTLKVEGQIFYKYPSRIRLEEQGNEKSVFVSNPFKTFYYKPSVFEGVPGELTVNKSNSYPLTRFLDSLRNGLESNDLYKVKKKKELIDFTFTKKGINELKIAKAQIGFTNKIDFHHVKYVEIVLDNDKKVRFVLDHVKVGGKLKEGLFDFKAPKGTRVSQ